MKRRIAQTSREAAESIAPHAASQRRRVYEFIAANPGCTRDQIGTGLGIGGDSVRPRVRELLDAGNSRVVDQAGMTNTGRKAERLMITALPYPNETTPTKPPVQRTLPLGG